MSRVELVSLDSHDVFKLVSNRASITFLDRFMNLVGHFNFHGTLVEYEIVISAGAINIVFKDAFNKVESSALIINVVESTSHDLIVSTLSDSVLACEVPRSVRVLGFAGITIRNESNFSHVEESRGVKGFFEGSSDSFTTIRALRFNIC